MKENQSAPPIREPSGESFPNSGSSARGAIISSMNARAFFTSSRYTSSKGFRGAAAAASALPDDVFGKADVFRQNDGFVGRTVHVLEASMPAVDVSLIPMVFFFCAEDSSVFCADGGALFAAGFLSASSLLLFSSPLGFGRSDFGFRILATDLVLGSFISVALSNFNPRATDDG